MNSNVWHCRNHHIPLTRPLIMGIVNVTPDSFSDGGDFFDCDLAIDHGLKLAGDGADILDVGGESTRPGSLPVPVEEELRRVIPVVRELAKRGPVPISIDTSKSQVAQAALDVGASIVNDVSALRADTAMASIVAQEGAGIILMHMRGTPADMQNEPTYENVVREVAKFLRERTSAAIDRGIDPLSIAVDPGIGFGKSTAHNLQLIAELGMLRSLIAFDRPLCLGVSRKRFIGELTGRPAVERTPGSLAIAAHAILRGSAQILRVHDVAPTRDLLTMLEAVTGAES